MDPPVTVSTLEISPAVCLLSFPPISVLSFLFSTLHVALPDWEDYIAWPPYLVFTF
jgi:hypothetical protein